MKDCTRGIGKGTLGLEFRLVYSEHSQQVIDAGVPYQIEVNVSALPAGLYQIRIASEVQIVNTKLLVID